MRSLCLVCAVGCGASAPSLDEPFASAATIANLTSLSVTHDGVLVRASAFGGASLDDPHDVRSITKTVTSLLVGIAIDRGCIASVDQPIGTLLGAEAPTDPAKAAITIGDVLTMSSGFQWSENGGTGDYNPWASAPDQVAFVLARPLANPPGQTFVYDSGAYHLLSVALTNACGATVDFASANLFAPLGIQPHAWETDAQGVANGAAGLQLANADLAAIGGLILAGGGGIVSASYMSAATSTQRATGDVDDETPGYGYGIWIGQDAQPFLLGEGYGGQMLVIAPDAQLVIAATSDWQGAGADAAMSTYYEIYDLIVRDIVPRFR